MPDLAPDALLAACANHQKPAQPMTSLKHAFQDGVRAQPGIEF
jgi:hypothetical protein